MSAKIGFHQVNSTEFASKGDVAAALPVGTSIMWTGDSGDVPDGFAIENGQAISRTTYSEYFTLVGTNYGVGDGSTTFNVADKRGLEPAGVGSQSLNGRTKTGPADPYSKQEDQGQGHHHQAYGTIIPYAGGGGSDYRAPSPTTAGEVAVDCQGGEAVRQAVTDGSNGTPRTGAETRSSRFGTYYLVRI